MDDPQHTNQNACAQTRIDPTFKPPRHTNRGPLNDAGVFAIAGFVVVAVVLALLGWTLVKHMDGVPVLPNVPASAGDVKSPAMEIPEGATPPSGVASGIRLN